jgi:hypothetical protein
VAGFHALEIIRDFLNYKLTKAKITRIRVNGDLRVVHYHRIKDLKHIEPNIIQPVKKKTKKQEM